MITQGSWSWSLRDDSFTAKLLSSWMRASLAKHHPNPKIQSQAKPKWPQFRLEHIGLRPPGLLSSGVPVSFVRAPAPLVRRLIRFKASRRGRVILHSSCAVMVRKTMVPSTEILEHPGCLIYRVQ